MKVKTLGKFTTCNGCGCGHPGQLVVHYETGRIEALCFTCWNPLSHGRGNGSVKVLAWINKYWRLQYGDDDAYQQCTDCTDFVWTSTLEPVCRKCADTYSLCEGECLSVAIAAAYDFGPMTRSQIEAVECNCDA